MTTGLVSAEVNLPVQLYTQIDPAWSTEKMGQTDFLFYKYGCYTTSLAMVFDCSFDINPKEMNTWLTNEKQYNSNAEIATISNVAKIKPEVITYITRLNGANLARINTELDSGYPVIAKINLGTVYHFFVITGYSGSTYYINDPLKNTPQVLNTRFGNPSTVIKQIIIFHGIPFPNKPTDLTQYKSDGSKGIPLGTTTNENTVIMTGGVSDPRKTNVQLEVEVKPVDTQFTGTSTISSSLVASGSTASVTYTGLSDGQYHWQARTRNSQGTAGSWQNAGGNAVNDADFKVSIAQASPITLAVSPSSGKRGTTFSFSGNGYTPNRPIEFHVRKPGKYNTEMPVVTLTASGSGGLSYNFQSITASNVGTFTTWAIDKDIGKRSKDVLITITSPPRHR